MDYLWSQENNDGILNTTNHSAHSWGKRAFKHRKGKKLKFYQLLCWYPQVQVQAQKTSTCLRLSNTVSTLVYVSTEAQTAPCVLDGELVPRFTTWGWDWSRSYRGPRWKRRWVMSPGLGSNRRWVQQGTSALSSVLFVQGGPRTCFWDYTYSAHVMF